MRKLSIVALSFLVITSVVGATDLDDIIAEKGQPPYENGRGIAGSVLVVESVDDTDPANAVISFIGENTSPDLEYWDRVTVELPAAWSIVSLSAEEVEAGSFFEFPTMSGAGTNVGAWYKSNAPCSGLGFLRSTAANNLARFIMVVNTNGVGGTVGVTYMIEGDNYNAEPHVVCSTTSPCAFDACYGAAAPEISADLSVTIAQVPTPTPVVEEAIPTNTNLGLAVLIGIIMAAGVLVIMRRS